MSGAKPACKFFMKNKNRNCRNLVLEGEEYCVHHKIYDSSTGRNRIPCPLDSGHLIFEDNLSTHLKKCPKTMEREKEKSVATYCEDLNAGSDEEADLPKRGDSLSDRRTAHVLKIGIPLFSQLLSKIVRTYEEKCNMSDDHDFIVQKYQKYLEPDGIRPFSLKHAMQQASIAENLRKYGMLEGVETVAEFGAGRGYLSSFLSDVTKIKNFLLIDTRSSRFKAERSMRSNEEISVNRVRADIKHFDASKLFEEEAISNSKTILSKWLACGKHLCGAATDYTLRSCLHSCLKEKGPFGMAVATCCHHACDWQSYVGKSFFLKNGLSKEDFEIVSWMTGWALCDKAQKNEEFDKNLIEEFLDNLENGRIEFETEENFWKWFPRDFKISIGYMCKGLIDQGRQQWMCDSGFTAISLHYVTRDISPENRLLLGTWNNTK